jgi:type-F conjugative transfer system secretin TraK
MKQIHPSLLRAKQRALRACLLLGTVLATGTLAGAQTSATNPTGMAPMGASPSAGNAIRPREVQEGATVFFRVPAKETTRFVSYGFRIRNTVYNPEELQVDKDSVTGAAYLTPLVSKQISVFVTTGSGLTFTLLLQPDAALTTASTIAVLDNSTVKPANAGRSAATPAPASAGLEQAVTSLLQSVASGRISSEIDTVEMGQEYRLWEGTRFVLQKSFVSGNLVLEQYELSNLSGSELRVLEQEFYQPQVLLVAIRAHLLAPGEYTTVYVIRPAKEDQ